MQEIDRLIFRTCTQSMIQAYFLLFCWNPQRRSSPVLLYESHVDNHPYIIGMQQPSPMDVAGKVNCKIKRILFLRRRMQFYAVDDIYHSSLFRYRIQLLHNIVGLVNQTLSKRSGLGVVHLNSIGFEQDVKHDTFAQLAVLFFPVVIVRRRIRDELSA